MRPASTPRYCSTVATVPRCGSRSRTRRTFSRFSRPIRTRLRAILIGPDFTDEIEVATEFVAHAVTAFTVDDLTTLLSIAATQIDVRAILTPGFAAEGIGDLVWERCHGRVKRIATVAALVVCEGWSAQVAAAALRVAGSTQACRREVAGRLARRCPIGDRRARAAVGECDRNSDAVRRERRDPRGYHRA